MTCNPTIVYFDLETLSPDTPFKGEKGESLEMLFAKNSVGSSSFHRTGAWIRQWAFSYEDKEGNCISKSWNIKPTIQTWSKEAIEYAKVKGFWEIPDAIPLTEAWKDICEFLEKAGPKVILVAFNGYCFDYPVVQIHKKRFGLKFPINVEILTFDPCVWVRGHKKSAGKNEGAKLKSLKMERLYASYFNKELPDAHTALGDAKGMMELFPIIAGGKEKWQEIVIARAKSWKIFVSSSLYGLNWYLPGFVKSVSLSKEAIEKLERAGYYTRAAVVYAHMQGYQIRSLVEMNKLDQDILESYVLHKINEIKKYTQTKNSPDTGAILKEGPKIPGLAKGGITRLSKHLGRDATLGDLRNMKESSGNLDSFTSMVHKIVPTINKKSVTEIWKWLESN